MQFLGFPASITLPSEALLCAWKWVFCDPLEASKIMAKIQNEEWSENFLEVWMTERNLRDVTFARLKKNCEKI